MAVVIVGILSAAAIALAVAAYNRSAERINRSNREAVLNLFAKYIYRKTLDELLSRPEDVELNRDLKWMKDCEKRLQEDYLGKWVAVINKEIVAVGTTGDEAWDSAVAKHPGRTPVVRVVGFYE